MSDVPQRILENIALFAASRKQKIVDGFKKPTSEELKKKLEFEKHFIVELVDTDERISNWTKRKTRTFMVIIDKKGDGFNSAGEFRLIKSKIPAIENPKRKDNLEVLIITDVQFKTAKNRLASLTSPETEEGGSRIIRVIPVVLMLAAPILHPRVPKHEILTLEEMRSLHMPEVATITTTDPMSDWMGIRRGDYVRITAPSPASGVSVSYRRCG